MYSPTRRLFHPVAWLAAIAVAATPAHATFYNWNNWAGGAATTTTNWSPNGTPHANDVAIFNAPATFTTTWASPVDSLATLYVTAGNPNFSIADHLGVSSSLYIDGISSLTVSTGRLTTGALLSDFPTLGQLIVDGPYSVLVAGSVNWGATGGASALMTLQNGGRLSCRGALYLAGDANSNFVGDVHHRVKTGYPLISIVYPVLSTVAGTGSFHDLIVGSQGSASLSAYDAGYVSSAGNLLVGAYAGASGLLHTYVSGLAGGVTVAGQTYVGANSIGSIASGSGTIQIEGSGNFARRVWLGDPDNPPGVTGVLQVDNAGVVVMGNGLTMSDGLGGRLDLIGGNTHILGGTVVIKQAAPFLVGSGVGHAPVLWLENGTTTDVWPNLAGGPTLGLGRGGYGTLRLAGAGTQLHVHGSMVIADSTYGAAEMDVDSAATAEILGRLTSAPVYYYSNLHVSGAGSTLTVQDTTTLGGSLGGSVTLTADSSATVNLMSDVILGAGSRAVVLATAGAHISAHGLTMGPAQTFVAARSAGARIDVTDHFDMLGRALAEVDSEGVLTYNGGLRALTIGAGGPRLIAFSGGQVQSASEIDVRGELVLSVFSSDLAMLSHAARRVSDIHRPAVVASGVTHAFVGSPLTLVVGSGVVRGLGTIQGRLHLDSPSALMSAAADFGTAAGRLIVGDSTRADGFVSVGQITIGPDTLLVLDADGGDLGKVSIFGGVLQLPKPARLKSGMRLDGNGTVAGALDVRDSAWVSLQGTVSGDLALAGTLDLGSTTGTLVLGSLHPASTGRVTVKIGNAGQDAISVGGAAVLAGTLDVRTIVGHSPAVGNVFTVLTAASVTGTFTAVTINGRPSAGVIQVLYGATDVRVQVTGAITAVDDGPPATPDAPIGLRFAVSGTPREAALALDLPAATHARVSVYDVSGRQLGVLADAELAAGRYRFALARVATGSGMVFARAELRGAGTVRVLTTRAVVLR